MERLARIKKIPLLWQMAPLLGLYWIYSSIRWLIARDSPYEAFANAFKIIQLEKQFGIFHELTIQSWLIDHAKGLVHMANVFYTIGYFPILILCGVLLYRFEPDRFQIFKNSFLLGLGFALVCFSVFPLAPPRMLPGVGFVDTQEVFSAGLYNHKLVVSFYNPYAAMPSLHFGWALLVGVMAYSADRRVFKIMGVLYPTLMAAVIVVTGHHYFLDIVGGGLIVGLAYVFVKTLPHLVKERSFSTIAVNRNAALKKPSASWPSARSIDHSAAPWSRDQRGLAQQQRLRSTIALFTIRKPPL